MKLSFIKAVAVVARKAEQKKGWLKGKAKRAKVRRVVIPMAKPVSTYKGGAFNGPGAVHQGSRARSL